MAYLVLSRGTKLPNEEISELEGETELRAHDDAIAGRRFREDGGLTYGEVLRRGMEAVEGDTEGKSESLPES